MDAHRNARVADLRKMYADVVVTKKEAAANNQKLSPLKPLLTSAFVGARKLPDHLSFHAASRLIHANVHQIGEFGDKNRPEIRTCNHPAFVHASAASLANHSCVPRTGTNSFLVRALEPNAQTNWRAP